MSAIIEPGLVPIEEPILERILERILFLPNFYLGGLRKL